MFSYISRDFFNSLSARDEALFYQKIELFFVVLVVAVPISVYYRFVREKLSLYWREALTSRVLDQYYANRTYFVLETMREVDNPDQRISADIKRFTKTSLDFFITILTSIIDLLSFSAILFQIYPGLFAAIIAYALAGSIATTSLGKRLASLNFQRLKSEADFRFGLLRTRENAEGMAFYDATAKEERSTVSGLFSSVVEAVLAQVVAQRDLEYFTTSYAFMVQVLPSLIVAPLYFAHKVELGAVSQSYSAFNHVLSDFSIIINEFEAISAFSASLTRLSAFFEKLEQVGWVSKAETEGNATTTPSTIVMERRTTMENGDAEMVLQCSNLTIITPDRKRTILGGGSDGENSSAFIAEGIDLTVRKGDRVLIVGPSGGGKSSLLRAIAGLWQLGSGTVTWYNNSGMGSEENMGGKDDAKVPKDVFFCPQKPYNPLGSLRQQIMYPNIRGVPEAEVSDALLVRLLAMVRLPDLAYSVGKATTTTYTSRVTPLNKQEYEALGLAAVRDWSKELSLGEQQRLAFARILFNRPRVVVLDGERLSLSTLAV